MSHTLLFKKERYHVQSCSSHYCFFIWYFWNAQLSSTLFWTISDIAPLVNSLILGLIYDPDQQAPSHGELGWVWRLGPLKFNMTQGRPSPKFKAKQILLNIKNVLEFIHWYKGLKFSLMGKMRWAPHKHYIRNKIWKMI